MSVDPLFSSSSSLTHYHMFYVCRSRHTSRNRVWRRKSGTTTNRGQCAARRRLGDCRSKYLQNVWLQNVLCEPQDQKMVVESSRSDLRRSRRNKFRRETGTLSRWDRWSEFQEYDWASDSTIFRFIWVEGLHRKNKVGLERAEGNSIFRSLSLSPSLSISTVHPSPRKRRLPMHTYIHIYTYMHAYIHTCIHIYTLDMCVYIAVCLCVGSEDIFINVFTYWSYIIYSNLFTGSIYLEVTMKAAQVVKIGLLNMAKNKNDTIRNFAPYKRADATLYVKLIPVSCVCEWCVPSFRTWFDFAWFGVALTIVCAIAWFDLHWQACVCVCALLDAEVVWDFGF